MDITEALVRELLAEVAGGCSYGSLRGWLMAKNLREADVAAWLRREGNRLGEDDRVREWIGCLANLRRGDLAGVAAKLVEGWKPVVGVAEELVDRGDELLGLGEYKEVLNCYDKAIEIKSGYYEAWNGRGNSLESLGRYEEAIASYDEAIEIKPDCYKAWYNRGIALGNLGRYEEAIASHDKAIEIKPDFDLAWRSRGIHLCDNLGRYEEAIASFDKAIEIQPDYYEAWHDRGIAIGNLGRYEEAIGSFNKAIEIKSDSYYAWNSRGSFLKALGRYEEAIASYDKAIEIKPDEHYTWYNRGVALNNIGRHEEAIISYDKAIEIKPDNDDTWYNRGASLGKIGRHEEALASYNKAIEIKPDSYGNWHNRGVCLCDYLGRYEEALASFDKAIEIKPDSYGIWHDRGVPLNHLGRYEEALASLDKAIEIKPNHHDAWYNRGVCLYYKLGRYEEALASFNKVIEIKPDHHDAWCSRGNSLYNLRRYEEAIASYDQAIEIKPDDHETWYCRAIAFGSLKGYEAKIAAYQPAFQYIQALTHPEGWGVLHHQIGLTHHQEGRLQQDNHRRSSYDYANKAILSYHKALETLTASDFPTLRLEVLTDLAKAHLMRRDTNPPNDITTAYQVQTAALSLWQQLLDRQPSGPAKQSLYYQYCHLLRTQVDLAVLQAEPRQALAIAELHKNKSLYWLLYSQAQQGSTDSLRIIREIEQLQMATVTSADLPLGDLLTPQRAILYWYLSSEKLTTFIIHPDRPEPILLTSDSTSIDNWLKTYNAHEPQTTDWESLRGVLQVEAIDPHLTGITELILIPHRDLHRLPLHILWPRHRASYLPSLRTGSNILAQGVPSVTASLLLIESPNYSNYPQTQPAQPNKKIAANLVNAEIEGVILGKMFKTTIADILPTGQVSKANFAERMSTPRSFAHFSGHAYHDSDRPHDSSLILENGEEFTCTDFCQLDLRPYYLIGLSACQTGTTSQSDADEYVGLVSACLSRGVNYVLSTLWPVVDRPSSMFVIYFYYLLGKGRTPPAALHETAQWLRQLTHQQIAAFDEKLEQWLSTDTSIILRNLIATNRRLATAAAEQHPAERPFSNPYYWAAFTISGVAPLS